MLDQDALLRRMSLNQRNVGIRSVAWLLALTLVLTLSVDVGKAQDTAPVAGVPSEAEQLFVHRILPLLRQKCLACHGDDPTDIRGGLDMRSRASLLRGGDSGEPAFVTRKPELSGLVAAVGRESDLWSAMPPKENDRLTIEQIQWLSIWIKSGAPWPDDEHIESIRKATDDQWNHASGVAVRTSGGLSTEWTTRRYDPLNLWAYQPLKNATPKPPSAPRSDSRIDQFIDARLKSLGLEPAPPADRQTLLKRACFDLTGLPPTAELRHEFLNDPQTDEEAFARLIDRLLDSPHYGEQWGRHWLDVTRYADSSGFANDYERGNAWRYRDYVIRSINQDKPYDQFILEQIAGDEIIDQSPEERTVSTRPEELLIAVGFLRMGPWELTGMEVARIARQRFLDDVTDVVGQVFLGHMLQCARCHDHKFDPIPTRDYYSIQAAFSTTQLAERPCGFLPDENTDGFDERRYLKLREAFYQRQLDRLDQKSLSAAESWYSEQNLDSAAFLDARNELQKQNRLSFRAIRSLLQKQKLDETLIPPRHVGFEPEDFGLERVARKGIERLRWRLERYEPYALSVYSGRTPELRSVNAPLRMPGNRFQTGELESTSILTGGDPFSPAAPVQPGVLSVVSFWSDTQAAESPAGPGDSRSDGKPPIAGRRLELARWIASRENPLTARVMVNRIWQWHFGPAIAGNPNNFGATGKKPTHPELLDFLAHRFIETGWSLKAMHRLIMNTRAYRRSSTYPQPGLLLEKDPERVAYAAFQPRRLDSEELRDAMLAVSGELNRTLGGIPVRPEMNLEAALQPRMVMGTFAEAWQPSPQPQQRHRRSIYALKIRGQRDPFQEVFNSPSADLSCEAREASTVTPQVFALFNSELTFDRALALSARILENEPPRQLALTELFRSVLGRDPDADELRICDEHWDAMTIRHQQLKFPQPEYPSEVEREAVEENTGEKFRFTEPLEFYRDFVPDLKPADADARTRGLAEVCLVLLNSNEFAYVH